MTVHPDGKENRKEKKKKKTPGLPLLPAALCYTILPCSTHSELARGYSVVLGREGRVKGDWVRSQWPCAGTQAFINPHFPCLPFFSCCFFSPTHPSLSPLSHHPLWLTSYHGPGTSTVFLQSFINPPPFPSSLSYSWHTSASFTVGMATTPPSPPPAF